MLSVLAACALASLRRTGPAPIADSLTATDLSGRLVSLLPSDVQRGTVIFFVLSECPNANGYAPEMRRIASDYGPKGFRFFLAYADSDPSFADLRRHAAQYRYGFATILASSKLLARSKATKSPEASVFGRSGDLLYHGRIDDRYFALGKRRPEPWRHDLRLVLEALARGKPAPTASTEVIGCVLPR